MSNLAAVCFPCDRRFQQFCVTNMFGILATDQRTNNSGHDIRPLMSESLHSSELEDPWLREDRRLLGRLLGEVIREQASAATLDLIESIRQTAVSFRRSELLPG